MYKGAGGSMLLPNLAFHHLRSNAHFSIWYALMCIDVSDSTRLAGLFSSHRVRPLFNILEVIITKKFTVKA